MLSLLELQTEFQSGVLKNDAKNLINAIVENHFSAEQQLQIYHNNILVSLTEALQSIYPNIQRLLGEDFFKAAANIYIPQNLPHTGSLIEFAGNFAEFLADFEHTKEMLYLVDIAKIDWACHQIYHAKDSPLFDLNKLRNIPEAEYEQIKFILNPASFILKSAYPVLHIIKICQEIVGPEETVNLEEGGDNILIIRKEMEITFDRLSGAEFSFLQAIAEGYLFEKVCDLTLQNDPKFDVNSYLQKCLIEKIIVDCETHQTVIASTAKQSKF